MNNLTESRIDGNKSLRVRGAQVCNGLAAAVTLPELLTGVAYMPSGKRSVVEARGGVLCVDVLDERTQLPAELSITQALRD